MIGTRIGAYEIVAKIGEGGMGEVYRATDANLKRAVAIKVLPEAVASDAERLARFQREAEVLAALNHPHIAAIYGLERSGATPALVMELVEGPTLADMLASDLRPHAPGAAARDQGLPVDEALRIARQIADALEAAHERGIIHRDLKPANIKVRTDGTVKVLDFGLAKAIDGAGDAGRHDVTNSPTITSPAMRTSAGMLLGTAAYMSPEQARGQVVDRRTDVWAFGAVLYEMLTGTRAFAGDDVSDVLASVLAREPDWTRLPSGLSPVLVTYLKRCLYKDRKQRIRDIGDVSLALDGAFEHASGHAALPAPVGRPAWRRVLPIAATAVVAASVAGFAAWQLRPPVETPPITRFDYALPEGQEFHTAVRRAIAISPDGRQVAYETTTAGIYLRSLDDLEPRRISGADGSSSSLVFSPDGQWLVYSNGLGRLRKIAISGGVPVDLCQTVGPPLGVSWSHDNTILFGQASGIMRVASGGGTPELVIKAGDREQLYGPQLLPDGKSIIFSVTTNAGPDRWNLAQIVVQSMSSDQRTVVVNGGSAASYLPTGHIVYALRTMLFAAPFDADRLTVTGEAVPLVQGVHRPVGVNSAGANYAVSEQGTLVYATIPRALRSLVWMNRDGSTGGAVATIPPGGHEDPRLSPDGGRVLVTRDGDIWIYELASGRSIRVTTDGSSLMAVWHPNGTQVAYSSARSGNLEAWLSSADGSGEARQLTTLGGQVHVDAWSPDGRTLSIHHHPDDKPVSIQMLPMDQPDAKPRVFLEGRFNAEGAMFSRDQRYVSYLSTESGARAIYIRPYPGPGGRTPVSIDASREPIWAANGDVFYRSIDGERMFVASVTTDPTLKVGTPVQLFQSPFYFSPTGSPRPSYDVTHDGQRLLMLGTPPGTNSSTSQSHFIVVQNWFDELKSKVPTH